MSAFSVARCGRNFLRSAHAVELDLHLGVQRGVTMGSRFDLLYAMQQGLKLLSEIDSMISMATKHRLDGFFIERAHLVYMQPVSQQYREVIE